MNSFEVQPFLLYWGMIWAVVGSAVTPLVFDRRNRNPWLGAVIGLVLGVVSGEVAGYLVLRLLLPAAPDLATWASMLGGLVLLIPLWVWLPARQESSRSFGKGFLAGTVTPGVFYLAVLSAFPMIWALLLAFFEYSPRNVGGPVLGLGGDNPFIGVGHFAAMLEGSSRDARIFQHSLTNTIRFSLLVLPLNFVITLPLAVMIESVNDRVKKFFRAAYFLPVVTSSVGVAVMWGYIFHAQYGILNDALNVLGIKPVAWLQDPTANILGIPVAMVAVVVAYLWQDFGYNLVIFIAALQNIPGALRDAAHVDGANPIQSFWYVTLPLLRPTILFTAVFTFLSAIQVFDIIQVMTQGGPGRMGATRVLVLDIYENAFRYEKMGWAAASSIVLFLVVLLVTMVQMRVLRTDWEY